MEFTKEIMEMCPKDLVDIVYLVGMVTCLWVPQLYTRIRERQPWHAHNKWRRKNWLRMKIKNKFMWMVPLVWASQKVLQKQQKTLQEGRVNNCEVEPLPLLQRTPQDRRREYIIEATIQNKWYLTNVIRTQQRKY